MKPLYAVEGFLGARSAPKNPSTIRYLQGQKQLVLFPNAGHGLLVTIDQELWARSISWFLATVGD